MAASKAVDVDKLSSLIADDAIFLVPGRPVKRKADFADSARAQAGQGAPQFDGSSEIQEIKVIEDWAFMWTKLTMVMTPPGGAQFVKRTGHTLTVLNKQK